MSTCWDTILTCFPSVARKNSGSVPDNLLCEVLGKLLLQILTSDEDSNVILLGPLMRINLMGDCWKGFSG